MMDFSCLANYREAWHAALSWCFGGASGLDLGLRTIPRAPSSTTRPGPSRPGAGFEVALNMQIVTGDGPIGESDAAQ